MPDKLNIHILAIFMLPSPNVVELYYDNPLQAQECLSKIELKIAGEISMIEVKDDYGSEVVIPTDHQYVAILTDMDKKFHATETVAIIKARAEQRANHRAAGDPVLGLHGGYVAGQGPKN